MGKYFSKEMSHKFQWKWQLKSNPQMYVCTCQVKVFSRFSKHLIIHQWNLRNNLEQARRGGGLFRESVNVVQPELKLQVEQDLEVAPLLSTLNLPHFKSFNLPRELKGERGERRDSPRDPRNSISLLSMSEQRWYGWAEYLGMRKFLGNCQRENEGIDKR